MMTILALTDPAGPPPAGDPVPRAGGEGDQARGPGGLHLPGQTFTNIGMN